MDNHPIDRLFREKLQPGHEQWPVNEAALDGAIAHIKAQELAERRKRRGAFFWWLAVPLLVIFTTVGMYLATKGGESVPSEELQKVESPEIQANGVDRISNAERVESPGEVAVAEEPMARSAARPIEQSQGGAVISERSVATSKVQGGVENMDKGDGIKSGQIVPPVVGERNVSGSEKTGMGTEHLRLTEPMAQLTIQPWNVSVQSMYNSEMGLNIGEVRAYESVETALIDVAKPAGLKTAWLIAGSGDVRPGILSVEGAFHDYDLRIGRRWALFDYLAVEAMVGPRFFSGQLPIHAQSAHVSYDIGTEIISYHLQADKLAFVGSELGLVYGHRRHRLSAHAGLDVLLGAYGSFTTKHFSQEQKLEAQLQDRAYKEVLIDEQRAWLDINGLNQLQWSSAIGYHYAVTNSFEVGVLFTSRFNELVERDSYDRHRLGISIKKMF
jgi:hypothetical protein